MSFDHEDESLSARFEVIAPAQAKLGEYTLRAVVTSPATGDAAFATGYQEIEYPHIQRRQVIKPAEADAQGRRRERRTPNVSVGYIVGVGDQVPPAIEQLGAKLTFIEQDELAWGDLSKYDVIVTGVRAYERRADLRAYNRRLLDYAERGGTVIVQYNKIEFNQAQYGPFPAKVSGNRVADETVPVKVLVPAHPVFNTRTGSGRRLGTAGCRSAACISLARRIRDMSIWCRWWTRFPTIRARSSVRSSRAGSERAAGSISASDSGVNCRPAPTAPISSWRT